MPQPQPFDTSMDFIIRSLNDPFNPTTCGGSLTAAVGSIMLNAEETVYCSAIDPNCRSELFNTLYRFVTIKRNRTTLKAWMARFSECPDCKLAPLAREQVPPLTTMNFITHNAWDLRRHEFANEHFYVAHYAFKQTKEEAFHPDSCAFIKTAIQALYKHISRFSYKRLLQGRSKEWPYSISDLIPFGSEETVRGLFQWYRIYPQPIILQLLALVASHVRFSVHRSLALVRFIPSVVTSTKTIVDLLMNALGATYPPDSPNRTYKTPMKEQKEHLKQAICEMLIQQIVGFYDVLKRTFEGYYIPKDIRLLLMDGYESKAVEICTLTHCLFPLITTIMDDCGSRTVETSGFNLLKSQPCTTSRVIYRGFGIQQAIGYRRSDIKQAASIANADQAVFFGPRDGFEGAFGLSIIWSNGFEYGCSAKSCTSRKKTTVGVSGAEVKSCKGCLGVYYCGRKCQKEDWIDREYPHKRLCPIIRKVINGCRTLVNPSLVNPRSTKYLRLGARGTTDLDTVKMIGHMIGLANLSIGEVEVLKGWGSRVYHSYTLEGNASTWHAGYEGHNNLLKLFTVRKETYMCQEDFVYFTKSPSAETAKEKAMLIKGAL